MNKLRRTSIFSPLILGDWPEIKPVYLEAPICSEVQFPDSLQFHFYFSEDIFIYSKRFALTHYFDVHSYVTSPSSASNLKNEKFLKRRELKTIRLSALWLIFKHPDKETRLSTDNQCTWELEKFPRRTKL